MSEDDVIVVVGRPYMVTTASDGTDTMTRSWARASAFSGVGSRAVSLRFHDTFSAALRRHTVMRVVVEPWQRSLVLGRYGIDPLELETFERRTPRVALGLNQGAFHIGEAPRVDPTREEAVSVVDFVTRAVLRLEDAARRHPHQ